MCRKSPACDRRGWSRGELTIGIPFVVFTVIAFVVLRLRLRWPIRRVLVGAILIGLVIDALMDLAVFRWR